MKQRKYLCVRLCWRLCVLTGKTFWAFGSGDRATCTKLQYTNTHLTLILTTYQPQT